MSTGVTTTSEMVGDEYIGGVSVGVGEGEGEGEGEEEDEYESEGENDGPRETLSAGGGRATLRMSGRPSPSPWRASGPGPGVPGGVCGRRPNSDRADARTGRRLSRLWPLAVLVPRHFRTTG
jgi:hypothetical protein